LREEYPNVVAVDLNCGCPQRIAQRGFFGSYLQDDMPLSYELVATMARESPLPLTVKIRILDDEEETIAYAKMLEQAGAALLTVHGRTRREKDHRKTVANWHILRKIREAITIPLIANGSVSSFAHIEECLAISGADGVMSATGLLDNPALFTPPPAQPSRWQLAREYLDITREHPPRTEFVARNHLFKLFCHELDHYPDLYKALVKSFTPDEMLAVVDALEQRVLAAGLDELGTSSPAHRGGGVSGQRRRREAAEEAAGSLLELDDDGDEAPDDGPGLFGSLFD
jgi:tRNA-dihydrouridine synthase 1